jgi:hypothetical protein
MRQQPERTFITLTVITLPLHCKSLPHSSPPTLSMKTGFYDPGAVDVFCYRLMILVPHKHNCFRFNLVCTFPKEKSNQYVSIGLYMTKHVVFI